MRWGKVLTDDILFNTIEENLLQMRRRKEARKERRKKRNSRKSLTRQLCIKTAQLER